uniref:Speckle-type POZ protein (inferred by orthology to a human protein) n=1 Tax=Strongyloides venezuelensis TaxID=75913 RepID=A0A0K0F522_STRVS
MASNDSFSKSNDEHVGKKCIEKAGLIWMIDNFSVCGLKNGEFKTSPIFHSKTDNKAKWYLQIYPKGSRDIDKDYISLYLQLEEIENVDVATMWNFYVLNQEGEKEYAIFSNTVFNKTNKSYGYLKFFNRNLLLNSNNKVLINDTLLLGCSVFYFSGSKNTFSTSTICNIRGHLNTLLNDFSNLFESSKFSDCIIKVGDSEIDAHRCILSDRSEVFDLILTEKKNECASNIIEIYDFSPEVVKEMIKYLYTGKLPNTDEMACEMLAIGDKYKLKELKLAAEESLIRSLNIENVCDYIVKSDLYSAETLKEWCLRFISLNHKILAKSEEWKKVIIEHPVLADKFFVLFANVK